MPPQPVYDVFTSCKSEDYPLVKPLYEYLVKEGLNVFFADKVLGEIGNAEYREEIVLKSTCTGV